MRLPDFLSLHSYGGSKSIMQEKSRNTSVRAKPAMRKRKLSSVLGSVWAKRLLAVSLCFFTALAISGTQLFPGTYPLGIALTAAVGGTLAAVSAALGSVIGSVRIPTVSGVYALTILALLGARIAASAWLSSDPSQGQGNFKKRIKSDGKAIIRKMKELFTEAEEITPSPAPPGHDANAVTPVNKVNSGTVLRENIRIRMVLSACAALFAGAWSVVEGGYDYYDLFGAVFALMITPLITYLFYAASERKMRTSPLREYGVYAWVAFLSLSLHQISEILFAIPFNSSSVTEITGENALLRRGTVFDVGMLFALTVSVVFSMNYGMHRGGIAGILCGITMTPVYAPMYALSAVTASLLSAMPVGLPIVAGGVSALTWGIFVSGIDGFTAVFPPVVVCTAVLIPLYAYDLIRLPSDLFGAAIPSRTSQSALATAAELSAGDMKKRLHGLSEGLESVSTVLSGMSDRLSKPGKHEMREIVEESFSRHCTFCKKRGLCRDAKLSKTAPLMRAMTDSLCQNGQVSAAVVPSSLASGCTEMGQILDEVNLAAGEKIAHLARGNQLAVSACDWALAGELFRCTEKAGREASEVDEQLSKKLKRLLSYNNFGASTVTAYGQRQRHIYVGDVDLCATRMGGDDIRRLFEEIVGQPLSQPEFELDGTVLSMRLHTVNQFACRTGNYSCAASSVQKYYGEKRSCGANSGESSPTDSNSDEPVRIDVSDNEPDEVSGDIITDFEADGKYYMILSDGMGSGKEAALTSGMAVSLLERLIRSGAELETALKMLNQIIRSTERECSATVDIAQIDLLTGEARFIKSGAAPSFILRDGSIFRLQSKTVPIGIIRALDAEMIRFDVQPGDTVVMVSDGAARSYDEAPWLLDLMTTDRVIRSGDERMAAMTIVSEAAIRGSTDDITCGILRVLKNAG